MDGMVEVSVDNIWNLVLFYFREEYALYVLIAGIIISFILSFAVGANDSANSWGTSVGAGTVSIGWAYVLGSIMEILGCTMLSGDVIKKVVNGIVNIDAYKSNMTIILRNWTDPLSDSSNTTVDYLYEEKLLSMGCISVMLGSGIWQLIASAASWPVSGTHCIIFGLLGFTITAKGQEGIKSPMELTMIIVYLFVSILVSSICTAILYYPLYRFCIRSGSAHDLKNKIVYAVLSGLAVGIPVAFIIFQTEKAYKIFKTANFSMSAAPFLVSIGVGLGVAIIVAALAILLFFPYLKTSSAELALNCDLRTLGSCRKRKAPVVGNGLTKDVVVKELVELENMEVTRIFRPLQTISAMTSALVHGGNDVANCIGPFVVVYYIYKDGVLTSNSASAPFAISLWGGVGIALGLILFGERVIKTMGSGISEMTASRGFCVEWMAALVVLIFTALGYPLSTTHCQVGAVLGAGLAQGLVETGSPEKALKFVNFRVLSGVVLSWILTIPFAFGLSSLTFMALRALFID